MSRTVVNLRDALAKKAGHLSGLKKKVQVVDFVLEDFVRRKEARKILDLAGKVEGDWNLREWRKSRYE